MVSEITQNIRVSVKTSFQEEYSSPSQEHFVFIYQIQIENNSDYTVQLLRRKWEIFDANGTYRQVDGEGVIGQQPILEQGENHEYTSGCNLKTGMGKMKGTYLFKRLVDDQEFEVTIPEFNLIVPYLLN